MNIKTKVFNNMYQDSVSLMQISPDIGTLPDSSRRSVAMEPKRTLRNCETRTWTTVQGGSE